MLQELFLAAMTLGSVGQLMQPTAATGGNQPPTFRLLTLDGDVITTLDSDPIRTIQDTP